MNLTSYSSSVRLAGVLALCSLASSLHGAAATQKAAPPVSPAQLEYAKAVETYVTAAGAEAGAHRDILVAMQKDPSPELQQRIVREDLKVRFDRWAQALEALKAATQPNFDRLKAEYEARRSEAIKALTAAREPAPVAPAVAPKN